jgi:hypothetical protein
VSINTRSLVALAFLTAFFSAISAWASPHISSISPTVGPVSPVGSALTINGTGFGASASGNTVTIGGVSATPTSWSDTRIVAPVPGALLPGFADVIVTSGGVASNSSSFLVIPVITNDSPAQGPVGTSVVVTGTSFGDTQGSSTITFNDVVASPSSWSNTSITVPVPSGATTGSLIVTVNGFSTNGRPFPVVPNITAIGPTAGQIGSLVTISGITFGQTQGFGGVAFNGVSATVQSWSDSSITALVPSGATSGNVVVTDHQLLASNGVNFNVIIPPAPVINSISPNAGRAGIGVTILGSNFGATQSGGTLTFNGLPAAINSWSDTSISTSAPAGVHTGPVVVTNSGGSSNGVQYTFAPGIRTQTQPLYITPDEISLEAGGSGSFKVVDASGNPVLDATWTVDSAALASIAADDPTLPTATLQALAPGEITITATSPLGTAQAKATIFDVGLMPAGTASWGFYPETQDNFFDFKVKSRRNSESDPFLYIPEGTDDFTHLNALSENGQLMWRSTLQPLDPSNTFSFPDGAAGTNDGGILVHSLETGGPNDAFTALRRFRPDGTPLWAYRSTSVFLSEPAIGPDGTVYVLDLPTLIAIDDATGTEKFRFAPSGGSSTITSAEQPGTINPDGTQVRADNPWKPCADFFAPGTFLPPSPTPPGTLSFNSVIGTDGSAYLMSTVVFSSFSYDKCQIVKVGTDPATNNPIYNITSMSGQLQYNSSVQLVRVTSSGGSAATQIGSISYSGQASLGPGAFNTIQWTFNNGASQLPQIRFDQVVPDADGGALITWLQQSSVLGDPFHGFLTKVLNDTPVSSHPLTASGVMATNDQGTVFFSESGVSVTAVDIASGTSKWTIPGTLLFATDDGGAVIQTGFSIVHADSNGVLDPDGLSVGDTASYMATGVFQVAGLGGSITSVPTNSNSLSQLLAGPWPVPVLGTPARQKQGIGIVLKEVLQQGIVPNGVTESKGCSGLDLGQAPKVEFGSLMAPIQATESSLDANGNLITTQTPASNVVSMRNNSGHTITLVAHIPPFGTQPNQQPADTTVRVTVSPQTLPADGQFHDVTFTGVAESNINRPVRIEAFDSATNEDRGDILQVDVKSWHRWFIDYYAVSELNGRLQPTPPLQATLQAELDRIFVPQANLGFTLTNKGPVADDYDVSPNDSKLHVPILIDPTTGAHSTCDLGFTSLGAINPGCTDDTELTPMYQRLITAQRQASQNQVIDLDNEDMFYLLYFKNFDKDGVGGFSDPTLASFRRRLPSVVHTDYATFPSTLLSQDRFNAITSVHEIGHKLGQPQHHEKTESQAKTYLMLRQFDISQKVVSAESDNEKYPCRLSRQDWIRMNYVYPTPR